MGRSCTPRGVSFQPDGALGVDRSAGTREGVNFQPDEEGQFSTGLDTFIFHVGETVSEEDIKGTVDVECPVGKEITEDIGPGLCKIDIPAQKGLKGVTFTNKAAAPEATPKKYITIHIDITKEIKYKETKTKLLCPFTNNFEGKDGSFFSTVQVKGYEDLGTHTPTATTDANGETTVTAVPTLTEGAANGIDIGA